MPKSYWLPKDERTVRAQTAMLKELREELEADHIGEHVWNQRGRCLVAGCVAKQPSSS
jgi:hypothetical protein